MLNRWWTLLLLLSGTLGYAGQPASKVQELFVPYWSSEPGWDTELQLKNNLSSQPLTVTTVLRLASGQEIPLAEVTIPANDFVSVSTSQALLENAPELLTQPGCYGSVVLHFNSAASRALHARSVLMLQGAPMSIPIRAYSGSQSDKKPTTIDGIWWHPHTGLNDILVISNVSANKISASLTLLDAAGKRWSELLDVGSHQTTRIMLNDVLTQSGLGGNFGGISIASDSAQSGLEAVHYVYEESGKFSAPSEMFRRDPLATVRERTGTGAKEWTIRAPMVALHNPDPALGLPSKTALQPIIFVRNTTAKTVLATITLNWRGDSAKGQAKLPPLQLDPFATQQLQIGSMRSLLQIPDTAHWALVSLTTTAQPDDLIAIASSRDASLRYGADANFVGGVGGRFAGGEWRADTNHNAIAAITNIGNNPTDALLTLHYDGGKQKYELQQTVGPGDQMWINLAQLIRNRVPDGKGNLLPVDVSAVTYDLQELTPGGRNLVANEVDVETTLGFRASINCPSCCPLEDIGFFPSFLDEQIGNDVPVGIQGVDSCNGDPEVLTSDMTAWGSDNTAVAKASYAQVQGIAAGTTTVYAGGFVNGPGECACSPVHVEPTAPDDVFDIGLSGKGYIFVGTDTNVIKGNQFYVTDSTGTKLPQPPGGTCCAASSDPSDTATQTAGPPNNPFTFQFTTKDQSSSEGDRTLTFEYSLSDGGATSIQKKVTAREFAYVTNPSPPNNCKAIGGTYGYDYTYVYSPFTHPDGQGLNPETDTISGTAVAETVTPQTGGTVCTGYTESGDGSLNTNLEFNDHVALCSNAKIPTCDKKYTQVIKIAGYPNTILGVRTNTLEFTNTQLIYTNQGPTQ